VADRTPDEWEDPYPDIEDSTARRELRDAESRLENAQTAEQKTASVIGKLRGSLAVARKMHDTNHYVERLRPIYRGTNHAA
jgi:hypothetical protein